MPVSITATAHVRGLRAPLARLVTTALALDRAVPGDVTIVLSDDATLRDLNRRYRHIDRATDVLSFTYDDASPTPALMIGARGARRRRVSGDLVISLERMEEQAKRYRVSRGAELARLVIHGTLHLAGLDHHRPAERLHMRAREEAAMVGARPAIAALDRALAGIPRA